MNKGTDLKGINCRGRNGWFKYDNYSTMVINNYNSNLSKNLARIEINSRRTGRNAPITISGDSEAVIKLLENIINSLKMTKQLLAARGAFKDLQAVVQHTPIHSSEDLINQAIGRGQR